MAQPEPARSGEAAFAVGERLIYDLRWSFFHAGEAVLEVLPTEDIGDVPAYHFRLTVHSTTFVDMFYRVRDRIDGYADRQMTRSLRYLKKQEEGDARRDIRVEFDWHAGKIHYHEAGSKEPAPTIDLPPGTFDPLSAFYYIRTLAFSPKDVIERLITDGKKVVTGRARVVHAQRVQVPAGSFDTYLLQPEMEHIGGVFEKEKGARINIWVTADHRHLPVKIASKVAVGSFVGELKSIESAPLEKTP